MTDAPEPLTSQTGDAVAKLTVTKIEECQSTLKLDEFYVTFDTPDHSLGKSTHALDPENLLVVELLDGNANGQLDLHESLLLSEGPTAVVPSGIQWTVWLMFDAESGTRGGGIDRDYVIVN